MSSNQTRVPENWVGNLRKLVAKKGKYSRQPPARSAVDYFFTRLYKRPYGLTQ